MVSNVHMLVWRKAVRGILDLPGGGSTYIHMLILPRKRWESVWPGEDGNMLVWPGERWEYVSPVRG